MKKFVSIVLSGVMLLSAIQAVGAAEEWLTYGNGTASIKYSTYTGSIKRAANISSTQDHAVPVNVETVSISVPTKINGTEITAVEKNGFFDFDQLASIELPATLQTLGEMAFMGADSLKKIDIPDKVAAIPKACFKSCDSLSAVTFGKSVIDIADQAFYSCKSLTSLSLNSNCQTIGTSAFELCTSLNKITLPSSIQTIGGSAFKGCKSLKSITIPSNVTTIEANTFADCTSLKTVQINGSKLQVIDKNAFKGCSELTDIYIPDSCKKIADNAFDDCKKVTIHCSKGSAAEEFASSKKISTSTSKTGTVENIEVPDKITVILDGKELDFDGVEPQMINGRTMVPMRAIFEELECVVNWDADTKTVKASRGVTNIELTIGMRKAYLNNKSTTLDSPACIVNGTTLVPLRFVGEALGLEVRWDAPTRTVNLISED